VDGRSIGTNRKVSQTIDRKADKRRLKCRLWGERVTTARRGPAEDAVRGRWGEIWEERSISSRSWHNHFHINGKLQLDQITAASRAVGVKQASRATAFTSPSCEAMRS